jgi:hypothetical protein
MTSLYVIFLVVILATFLTLALRYTRSGVDRKWREMARRLGLEARSGRPLGSLGLDGSFQGFEVRVSLPASRHAPGGEDAPTVVTLRIKHRVPPGAFERWLGAFEDDDEIEPPDLLLQEAIQRLRERHPQAELDLNDELITFTSTGGVDDPDEIEQVLRHVSEIGELIGLAVANGDVRLASLDRTSSPSSIPPESGSSQS